MRYTINNYVHTGHSDKVLIFAIGQQLHKMIMLRTTCRFKYATYYEKPI